MPEKLREQGLSFHQVEHRAEALQVEQDVLETLSKDCNAPNGLFDYYIRWPYQNFLVDIRVKDLVQLQYVVMCNKLANQLTNRSLINSINAQY